MKKEKTTKKFNVPAIVGLIFLILDFLLSKIFVGYYINSIGIAAIAFGYYRLKSKNKITYYLSILLIICGILLIGLNVTQKSYFKTEIDNREVKIEMPRFTLNKGKSKNGELKFKVIFNRKIASINIDSYLDTLKQETCNSNYYYDKSQNISIGNFNIDNDGYIIMKITSGNFCELLNNNIKVKTYKNFIKIDEIKRKYSSKDAINDGYFVSDGTKNYNTKTLTNFLNDIKNNKEVFVRVIISNNIGEITIADINYKNNKFELNYDNTRDTLINPQQILFKTYNKVSVVNNYLYIYNNEYTDGIKLAYIC